MTPGPDPLLGVTVGLGSHPGSQLAVPWLSSTKQGSERVPGPSPHSLYSGSLRLWVLSFLLISCFLDFTMAELFSVSLLKKAGGWPVLPGDLEPILGRGPGSLVRRPQALAFVCLGLSSDPVAGVRSALPTQLRSPTGFLRAVSCSEPLLWPPGHPTSLAEPRPALAAYLDSPVSPSRYSRGNMALRGCPGSARPSGGETGSMPSSLLPKVDVLLGSGDLSGGTWGSESKALPPRS